MQHPELPELLSTHWSTQQQTQKARLHLNVLGILAVHEGQQQPLAVQQRRLVQTAIRLQQQAVSAWALS